MALLGGSIAASVGTDPKLGRYTQPDPLSYSTSVYNLYQYADNNPLNYVDPFGISCFPGRAAVVVRTVAARNCLWSATRRNGGLAGDLLFAADAGAELSELIDLSSLADLAAAADREAVTASVAEATAQSLTGDRRSRGRHRPRFDR
jgi:uncharacterized protein RhaS with RHS repeats